MVSAVQGEKGKPESKPTFRPKYRCTPEARRARQTKPKVSAPKDRIATAIMNQLQTHQGSLNQSERNWALELGAHRSQIPSAIKGLSDAGLVSVEKAGRQGTTLKLLALEACKCE